MRLFSVGRSAVYDPALTLEPVAAGSPVAACPSASPALATPAAVEGATARLIHRVGIRLGHRADHGAAPAPASRPVEPPLPDRLSARSALGLPLGVAVFAVVGPLDRQAGPERVWRAWAAVRRRNAEALLLVLADVPVPALPGVRAVGEVPDLAAYLDASDAVLVLARRLGLPGTVVDALDRGVSVIASREAVGDGDASWNGPAIWSVDGDHTAQIADTLLARWAGTVQWMQAAAGMGVGLGRSDWTW